MYCAMHYNNSGLTSLTSLNLERNRLVQLPLELGKLSILTRLKCNNNMITVLPEAVMGLVKLQVLELSTVRPIK
jgi:Leucine-rich repeat (LRR) protein